MVIITMVLLNNLRDTDKSRYFATTEFKNCFIIWSPNLFFLMNILGKRSALPFSRKGDRKKEKSTVSFTHVHNIICSQTQLDGIAHEQTIICRQLFAGHVVGSWPMKRKKNLLRMIMNTYGENNNDGDNDGEYYNMLCIFFKNFLKLASFLFFFSWKRFELE